MVGYMTGVNAYKNMESDVKVYSGVEIVCKLYQGIIDFLNKAVIAMDNNNKQEKTLFINKTIKIINDGLLPNLDFEKGGEISTNLYSLYGYSIKSLIEADLKNDKEKIMSVIKVFSTVKEGWDAIKN